MPKIDAEINDEEYNKRVKDLISQILQSAFKSNDLKTFLYEIVEIGAVEGNESLIDLSHDDVELFGQLLTEEYGLPDNIDDFINILSDILYF